MEDKDLYKIKIMIVIFIILSIVIFIIVYRTEIFNYMEIFNLILTIFPGSYGINYLYNENSYWNYISKITFQNKIIYFNDKIINNNFGGYIIVSNHVNVSDVVLIRNKIDCYVVCKDSIISKEYPYLNCIDEIFFNNLKLIPYKRNSTKSGNVVKEKILSITSKGENVLVFPEGTSKMNCHTGILPFKKGLFYLAYENKIPILPVVIYYTDDKYGLDKKTVFSPSNILNNKTDIIVKFFKPHFPIDYKNVDNLVNTIYNIMNKQILKYNKILKYGC